MTKEMIDLKSENKISIVMPAYNSELYIEEVINSVINQSYTNWELLIVDDGSTDSTGDIIDSYALTDNRIKVFHTSNYGVSHARNVGLDNATGEWLNFLDSDDILPNNALESLISNSKGYDIIIGNYESFPQKINNHKIDKTICFDSFKELEPFIFIFLNGSVFSNVWGKLIKKSVIDFYFDENYQNGEDALFFATLLKKTYKIKMITDYVYHYRFGNMNSLSNHFTITDLSVHDEVAKTYINLLKSKNEIDKIFTFYLIILIKRINLLFNDSNLNDNDLKENLKKILSNGFIRNIPIKTYPLSKELCRKVAVLLIGDINMIIDEFKKNSQ